MQRYLQQIPFLSKYTCNEISTVNTIFVLVCLILIITVNQFDECDMEFNIATDP